MLRLSARRLLGPFVLAACLPPGVAAAEADEASVLAAARALYGEGCYALMPEAAEMIEDPVQRHDVTLPGYEGMEPQDMVVWEMICDFGAYNMSSVFWLEDPYGGLRPLAFARPVVDIVLERPEDPESPVREVRVGGWAATGRLVNASFDPATAIFTHYSKYRGLGDASETGTWRLDLEETVILTFEVDATYDDEVNPVSIYRDE